LTLLEVSVAYRKTTPARTLATPPPSATAHVISRTALGALLATAALAIPGIGTLLLGLFGVPIAFADAKRARLRRQNYARTRAAFLANPAKGTAVGHVEVTTLHKVI
jgi:hypothetical protein